MLGETEKSKLSVTADVCVANLPVNIIIIVQGITAMDHFCFSFCVKILLLSQCRILRLSQLLLSVRLRRIYVMKLTDGINNNEISTKCIRNIAERAKSWKKRKWFVWQWHHCLALT